MTLRGGTHTGEEVTYELENEAFWFRSAGFDPPKSIVSVTYGNTDFLARVADVPFYHQAIGISADWNFAAPPLGNQDLYSLAGSVLGSPAILDDIRARGLPGGMFGLTFLSAFTDWRDFIDAHGSVLGAIYGATYDTDPDASTKSLLEIIRALEAKIVDLEDRVQWLENQ
ncbi:hypothetical protein [uncultured Agrobacterium sp.]|uniref:hypothetical protein n=1 Tax=uncultured Agrobacterium sp. TaxID=157277 RepID=UPI0025DBBC2B|nr:hypothetical protein [uncultured Agrobacterium sp.]